MNQKNIYDLIASCDTMPKLDAIRLDVVKAMKAEGQNGFRPIQNAFRKQKGKLKRTPLKDRVGW